MAKLSRLKKLKQNLGYEIRYRYAQKVRKFLHKHRGEYSDKNREKARNFGGKSLSKQP